MDDNKIIITDEDGKETEMNILLSFEANGKQYVITYFEENEEEIYPFAYDENNNLYYVEDEEELAMIDEVVSAFDGVEEDDQEQI